MDFELRKEWLENYFSKVCVAMIEATNNAETPGEVMLEVMLMHKFAEVAEKNLSIEEREENETI